MLSLNISPFHGAKRCIDCIFGDGGPQLPEEVQIKGGGGLNVVRIGGAHKLVCHIGIAHEMKILPSGDGKTMSIIIDDGASYKTKGASNFVKIIRQILDGRGIAGWDETREGQDNVDQVLFMYKDDIE